MKKNFLNYLVDIYKVGLSEASKHAPEILAGVGISGFIGTVVLAVKATPTVEKAKEEKKKELNKDKLSFKEKLSVSWKPYLPAGVTGVASTMCIIGSVSKSLKRTAAATVACNIVTDAYKDYRREATKIIGEEKDKELADGAAQRNGQVIESKNNVMYVVDPMSKQLFYDEWSGTTFISTEYDIQQAIKKMNDVLEDEGEVSFMEYGLEIGLEAGKMGSIAGWRVPIDPRKSDFISVDTDEVRKINGRSVIVVKLTPEPSGDYMYD